MSAEITGLVLIVLIGLILTIWSMAKKEKKISFLYRGESKDLYEKNSGVLIPKSMNPFDESFIWDETYINWEDGNIKLEDSNDNDKIRNAVIIHQLGYPTRGISTTPHFNCAKYYALGGGKHAEGVVYKIDRSLLHRNNIVEYVVADIDWPPKIQKDDELILVFDGNGPLPNEIVSNKIKVKQ